MDPLSSSKEPHTESNDVEEVVGTNDDQQRLPMARVVSSLSSLKLNKASKAESSDTQDASLGNNNNHNNNNNNNFHWVFHFDINETILVGDEVGGDTCDDCFHKMIAKSAFCQMPFTGDNKDNFLYDYDNTSSLTPTHWWDGTPFTCSIGETDTQETKPSSSLSSAPPAVPPPPLYTGWEWPHGCCPYYRTSLKRISKTFVHHHGAIYKPIYNEIVKRMAAANDGHLDENFHHILPAFFHTLYHLIHNNTHQNKPPVTIVFRTFGTDLPRIAHAMTAFCQGKHPDYPDFIHPEYELGSSRLYNAKWVPIIPTIASNIDATTSSNHNNKEYFQYQLFRQDTGSMVASGDQQVLDLLHGTTNDKNNHDNNKRLYVYGIRDDYPMWKHHNWEPWAGKPVWITKAPTVGEDQRYHHHVLFDDNIHNLPHDGIASIRRRVSIDKELKIENRFDSTSDEPDRYYYFESLSGPEIQKLHGLHLIRVPTIEPILHVDWFLQQIDKVKSAAMLHYQTNNDDEKAKSS